MSYLLIRAVTDQHLVPGSQEYVIACKYRGAIVESRVDTHVFTPDEQVRFVRLWVPGLPLDRIARFARPQADPFAPRRVWRKYRHMLRWADMPAAARNKLQNSRQIVISSAFYDATIHPPADYSWLQVRSYLRDLETDTDESGDL